MFWSKVPQHIHASVASAKSRISVSVWLSAWLIAVVAGPFGTFQTMGIALRAVYWFGVITSGLAIGLAAEAVVQTLCRGWSTLWIDAKVSLAITTALTPLIFVLRAGLDPVLTRADLSLGAIWVNTVLFVGPIYVLRRHFAAPTPAIARPLLLRRLPVALRDARVLRLAGRDHMVEVVTDRGRTTLRLRLADAIDEMAPVEGVCPHRSHWVALDAVTGTERAQGRTWLILADDDRVPVSRTYALRLEAGGLLPARPETGG